MAGAVLVVSFIGIWACALKNKTGQAHMQKRVGKTAKKNPKKLLIVVLTLICNLAAGERKAQHKVLSATPRTWQA